MDFWQHHGFGVSRSRCTQVTGRFPIFISRVQPFDRWEPVPAARPATARFGAPVKIAWLKGIPDSDMSLWQAESPLSPWEDVIWGGPVRWVVFTGAVPIMVSQFAAQKYFLSRYSFFS